jgi:voltage-gated potassium channel
MDTTTTPADAHEFGKPDRGWRRALYRIVFESDTRIGQLFDVVVIAAILLSVAVVIADSMISPAARYGPMLTAAEWMFTALFTIEYLARLVSVQQPLRYALSFYGVIDLLSVLPTYLAMVWPRGSCSSTCVCCGCCGCSGSSASPSTWRSSRSSAARSVPAGARFSCSCRSS